MAKKKREPLPEKPLLFAGKEKANTSEKWDESQRGKKVFRVEPPEGGWDANYVPGYSDERHHWESQGESPSMRMPARLQWVRATGPDPDPRQWREWARKGYVLAKADPDTKSCPELEKWGWQVPEQSVIQPNGYIRKGNDDAILAYCPGELAKENYRKEREDTAYQEGVKSVRGQTTGVAIESEEEERRTIQISDGDVGPA